MFNRNPRLLEFQFLIVQLKAGFNPYLAFGNVFQFLIVQLKGHK